MNKGSEHAHTGNGDPSVPYTPLDESSFIRSKLFSHDRSAFDRYKSLVFHHFTWPKLIRYELLTTFLGPLAGAIGLALRKRSYRSLFRQVGKGVIFGQNLTLHHTDRITLGDDIFLDQGCVLDARGAGDHGIVIGDRVIVNRGAAIQAKVGYIEIGNDCNIGANAELIAQGPIVIGNNVSIAGKAIIAGGRYVVQQEEDAPGAKRRFTGGEIHIGDNTRIGMGAIIQDGVSVGANAIVAPGAVVYENVADDTVVWGNPARPVRGRGRNAPETTPSTVDDSSPDEKIDALRKQVCVYLENDLFVEVGNGEIGYGDSLLDAGIMDSLALVRLLLWIEQQFDINLDFATLDPSEIDSVDKIVTRINERMQ